MKSSIFLRCGVWIGICVLSVILIGSAGICNAGKITNFSAEQVVLNPDGTQKSLQKMYVSSDKVRTDAPSFTGEGTMTMILRKDRGVMWMLNPEKKTYTENPLREEDWQRTMRRNITVKKGKNLGTEKVSGYRCKKKEMETTVKVMGIERTSKSTVWTSSSFDMPLRTQGEDGYMMEVRNIKPGRQSGRLFELPKGYTRVENMLELVGEPKEGHQSGMMRTNVP